VKYEKLVLFDIDGTIMNTDGAGNQSFVNALTQVFGREFSAEGYSTSGKTDTQIAIELGEKFGIPGDETEARLGEIRDIYLAGLEREFAGIEPTVLPRVRELVAAVAGNVRCVTGLLTGNFERWAWIKLDRINLSEPFEMGAFGDGAKARIELPDQAVKRARELTGQTFENKEIVIIGDTPNDVACGRHLNVKSIAVATGNFGEADLVREGPDFLFEDFTDTDRVVESILS
jgi:phosphoglycolate phosphatase-like HAD superfamily hydrolase